MRTGGACNVTCATRAGQQLSFRAVVRTPVGAVDLDRTISSGRGDYRSCLVAVGA